MTKDEQQFSTASDWAIPLRDGRRFSGHSMLCPYGRIGAAAPIGGLGAHSASLSASKRDDRLGQGQGVGVRSRLWASCASSTKKFRRRKNYKEKEKDDEQQVRD
jgi:hypothetical protein